MKPIPKIVLQTRPELDGARDRARPRIAFRVAMNSEHIAVLDSIANDLTAHWRETGSHHQARRSDAVAELVEQYRRNPPQIQEPDPA